LLKILNVSTRRPLIGIPADRRLLGHHYFHCVGEKYIAAVAEGAQAVPVLIPSLDEGLEARELLADFDGILLTGSPSNVAPNYFGPGLVVGARAPDGVIEAFRAADAPSFALGLQWHPEWKFKDNSFSRALFAAFGEAARERTRQRAVR
jgi:gamma-glutamyl-gamma-aminobutyrate hydrolase PuuD